MAKSNFAAISRVDVKAAADIFHDFRDISSIAEDCAREALRVLHDGLSNPSDKLRLSSATALLAAHVKLASIKAAPGAAPILPPEEQVAALTQALTYPHPELQAALVNAGYAKQGPSQIMENDDATSSR